MRSIQVRVDLVPTCLTALPFRRAMRTIDGGAHVPATGVSIYSRTPAIRANDNEVGRDCTNFTKESWFILLAIVLNCFAKSGAGSTFSERFLLL